jgi:3-hydroxyacyl-CoA dehydrogenase/enoyl-CoA hydratase/3-hydroxybutyryl-CoA epimerase
MTAAADFRYHRDADGVGWLVADRQGSSANTLSRAVLESLAAVLDEIERDPPPVLVVHSGKPRGFIAGADIAEFRTLAGPEAAYSLIRTGQAVLARLEALPSASVAALAGFALGGGLELALACRYRMAANDATLALGFPEVRLGIHPGFGGTVRAPRRIGARAALDLMLTGRTVRAAEALKLGLVDGLAPPERLLATAVDLAREAPRPRRAPFLDRVLGLKAMRSALASKLRLRVAARARPAHYPAPFAIIDLWSRFGAEGPQAYEAEARSVARLAATPTARHLVDVYFLQERLKGLAAPAAMPAVRVHVIGAGVMGGDIAAWCAGRGLSVTLEDRDAARVGAALERARAAFDRHARDPADAAAKRARLVADADGRGVADADVVIEAIAEDAAAKAALYAALEPRLKAGALLATNTSSLTLEQLAAGLADPARLVGLHFFNPVAQMPLVEVVHGPATGAAVLAAALAFARQLDKLPLPCASRPGFLVNRILFPYLSEAMLAAGEGIPKDQIDEAAVAFGMPMGPIELADTVGLDVARHVGDVLAAAYGGPRPTVLDPLVAAGQLGRKSGAGLYRWADGKPVREVVSRAAPPADLADRLVLRLVNEAVACLREGVVGDADLVDAGAVFGAGFAPFRGGPLAYARAAGTAAVVGRLDALAARHGPRFAPDAGWADLGS